MKENVEFERKGHRLVNLGSESKIMIQSEKLTELSGT